MLTRAAAQYEKAYLYKEEGMPPTRAAPGKAQSLVHPADPFKGRGRGAAHRLPQVPAVERARGSPAASSSITTWDKVHY
jgi:hypothetical protein